MVVKLIAKDKNNKKFQFEGRSKLLINCVSKMLLVQPFNEDFKLISALFKWNFVAQKNIIFVFAENHFQDFALIFESSTKSKKIYELMLKKGGTSGTKELIKERFLPALFKQMSEKNDVKINEIFLNWIERFDGKEKEEYIKLLQENNVHDLIYQNRGEREGPNLQFVNCSSSNTVELPNFEKLKYIEDKVTKTKLSIFPTTDRKYCYEYFWEKSCNMFICYGCKKRGKTLTAKIGKRNGKEIVQLNDPKHICELKEYKEIIEKPYFEFTTFERGKEIYERLIIFLDSFRRKCFEYRRPNNCKMFRCCGCFRKSHSSRAKILQKEDGTEFVMIKLNHHICKARQFNAEKYGEKEIIQAENFKVFKNIQNGINRSKLVVFTSSEKRRCYEYFWHNSIKNFQCCGCSVLKKYISAKVCQNPDGSEYLKPSRMKHVCEPREYDAQKYEMPDKIFENSNFKVIKYKHNGSLISKLIIFCPTNKNLCYEYYWNNKNKIFYCNYCPVETQVTATVCKNDDTKEYLSLSKTEHVCILREFDEEKYKDDIVLSKSMYLLNPSSSNRNGSTNPLLLIFTSEDRTHCYRYLYHKYNKKFHCAKCRSSHNIRITATIQNEGKENECIFVSHQQHLCEPLKYSPPTNENIIMAPNFQLIKRKSNGKVIQRLIIFINEDKSECFEYSWNLQNKKFVCRKCCSKHKIHVNAKIIKDNENKECVEMFPVKHQCKPIKFVPENIEAKTIKAPNFKLWEEMFRKKMLQRLTIFDSENKKFGYIYTYQKKYKKYFCYSCSNKHKSVFARLLQDENGESYVEMGKGEHVCKLQKL